MRDKVTRQCPQTTTFEGKGEPKRIRTEAPLLTSLCLPKLAHLGPQLFFAGSQSAAQSFRKGGNSLCPPSRLGEGLRYLGVEYLWH